MLREELLREAKSEAERIRNEAQEEARAIVHEAEEKKQQEREQKEKDYEQEKQRLDNKRYAQAAAIAKKKSLEAQSRAIEELKTRVRERLDNEKTCKKLYAMAKKVVEPKKAYCNKDCKTTMKRLVKNVHEADIDGIRLENENESVTITVDDLIDTVIEDNEEKIIKAIRAL